MLLASCAVAIKTNSHRFFENLSGISKKIPGMPVVMVVSRYTCTCNTTGMVGRHDIHTHTHTHTSKNKKIYIYLMNSGMNFGCSEGVLT